ncbi:MULTISPECIES: hypothetical protein [Chitinophagaceae]
MKINKTKEPMCKPKITSFFNREINGIQELISSVYPTKPLDMTLGRIYKIFGSYHIRQKGGLGYQRLTLGMGYTFSLSTDIDMGIKSILKIKGKYTIENDCIILQLPSTNRGKFYQAYSRLHILENEERFILRPQDEESNSKFCFIQQPYPHLAVCQKTKDGQNNFFNSLTSNHIYMVLNITSENNMLIILNDKNRERKYPAAIFDKNI